LEDAELVAPGVAHDPEVVAAFFLVVPTGRAEGFEASDLGLDEARMAIRGAIPMQNGDAFPHGSWLAVPEVQPMRDFDRSTREQAIQAVDRDTGELVWAVDVIDADPDARERTVRVKLVAPVRPVPPESVPGVPFRPVEFEGLTATPYVATTASGRGRLAWSFRATGMRARMAGCSSARRVASRGARTSRRRGGRRSTRWASRACTSTTCAIPTTWMAAESASLRELMARMGHSSTRAALIYQHASRERERAIGAAISARVEGDRSKSKGHARGTTAESPGKWSQGPERRKRP
jgi:hypothetical protein